MLNASEKLLRSPNDKGKGVSILSLQNGAKLPRASRTAKGIAIQKILESTQKPWFMLNGMEYNRPSPFAAPPGLKNAQKSFDLIGNEKDGNAVAHN